MTPNGTGTAVGVRARVGLEDLVWIIGSGRSGSTWLSQMLGALPGAAVWLEPNIPRALAPTNLPQNAYEHSPLYVLGGVPEHWVPPVRAFILAAVRARYPDHRQGDPLILKDQNSAEHVGRVLQAVPESRLLVLVRDPRDVMASIADALRASGSWAHQWVPAELRTLDHQNFDHAARACAQAFEAALAAHDRHPGPKTIVTYEELRAEPHAALRRIADTLAITAPDEGIAAAVAANAWEKVPESAKGSGRFHRKATPGGWRDDLTAEEIASVERHAASLLHRFYGGAAPKAAPAPPADATPPAFVWPVADPAQDPQLTATQALIDRLRAKIEEQRANLIKLKQELRRRGATDV